MLYNVRIFGRRYKNKTKADAIALLSIYADQIEKASRVPFQKILIDITLIHGDCTRLAFYGHDDKVIISLNKVK